MRPQKMTGDEIDSVGGLYTCERCETWISISEGERFANCTYCSGEGPLSALALWQNAD